MPPRGGVRHNRAYCQHTHPSSVRCGSPKCTKLFGFTLYYMSDRVLRDLRDELKRKRDERIHRVEVCVVEAHKLDNH